MNASNKQHLRKQEEETEDVTEESIIKKQEDSEPKKGKVILPCDDIQNKILYSNTELEVFATGKLF